MSRIESLPAAPLVQTFKVVAILEAISWLALLISMGVKYGADIDSATMAPGMIHGIIFVVFVVVTLVTAARLKWSARVAIVGVLSSIPPFCSVLFEQWASRKGLLDTAGTAAPGKLVA